MIDDQITEIARESVRLMTLVHERTRVIWETESKLKEAKEALADLQQTCTHPLMNRNLRAEGIEQVCQVCGASI